MPFSWCFSSWEIFMMRQRLTRKICWRKISIFLIVNTRERFLLFSLNIVLQQTAHKSRWSALLMWIQLIERLKYWPRSSPLGFPSSCATNYSLDIKWKIFNVAQHKSAKGFNWKIWFIRSVKFQFHSKVDDKIVTYFALDYSYVLLGFPLPMTIKPVK